jgi:hypothetical protein
MFITFLEYSCLVWGHMRAYGWSIPVDDPVQLAKLELNRYGVQCAVLE